MSMFIVWSRRPARAARPGLVALALIALALLPLWPARAGTTPGTGTGIDSLDLCNSPGLLWANGGFDGRNGVQSQITPTFQFRAADDFYLPPGAVHRITSIRARLASNSREASLTALLEVYEDCSGLPGTTPIATFPLTALQQKGTFNGNELYNLRFDTPNLWLRGGVYWVSVVGTTVPQTGPQDQWHFLTANNDVPRGRPGASRTGTGPWIPLPSGCSDLSFTVRGRPCTILYDGGIWDAQTAPGGTPSLQNANNTGDASRTADNFVVPPCDPVTLCYLEAYIYTNQNSARGRIDLYAADCAKPGYPIATYDASATIVGTATINGQTLNVVRLVAYDVERQLAGGRNYWVSAYAVCDGQFGARGLFAFGRSCGRTIACNTRFGGGWAKGAGVGSPNAWVNASTLAGVGVERDFAFTVGIEASPTAAATFCPADTNGDFRLTTDDIFGYLNVYFAGCQ